MKKFIIAIEETCAQEFEINAETDEEAMNIAKERYRNGELALELGEVQFRQMAIVEPDDSATEWTEF